MLKIQLHCHAREDHFDRLNYNAKQLIDTAKKHNFDAISLTFHEQIFFSKEIQDYAKKKNIVLIPGIEKSIEKKHVLIIGLEKLPEINSFKDLQKIKDNALIIAPHPFFPRRYSLKKDLIKNINYFNAIEYSFFYTWFLNYPNKKAKRIAKKYKLPLLGTSDVHNLNSIENTFTMVDSEKNIPSIIKAINENKIEIKTRPLSILRFSWILTKILLKLI